MGGFWWKICYSGYRNIATIGAIVAIGESRYRGIATIGAIVV
jgi:hypothetical protein